MACVKTYKKGQLQTAAQLAADLAMAAGREGLYIVESVAFELAAYVSADSGDITRALANLVDAEGAATKAVDDSGLDECLNLRARVRFQISSALFDMGVNDQAATYLELAKADAVDKTILFRIDSQMQLLEVQALSDWRERLRRSDERVRVLESVLRDTPDKDEDMVDAVIRAKWAFTFERSKVGIAFGDPEQAIDGFIDAAGLAVVISEYQESEFLCYTRAFWTVVNRPDLDVRRLLEELVPLAWSLARQTQNDQFIVRGLYLQALGHWQSGDLSAAVGCCLDGIEAASRIVTGVESSAIREAYADDLEATFDLAITLAVKLDDAVLAAELLESSRLQCAPMPGPLRKGIDPGENGATATPGVLQDVLRGSPIEFRRHISVAGRSLLGGRDGRQAQPISLESVIHRVAGSEAWWWSVRLQSELLSWCVRDPSGRFECGQVQLNRQLLEALSYVFNRFRSDATEDEESGLPFGDDLVDQEQSYLVLRSSSSGRLIDVLKSATKPIKLVVSGNIFLNMSLPAVCVSIATGRMLIEAATLYMQPPSAIVDGIKSRYRITSIENLFVPPLVSCMDPTDDLPNSYHANSGFNKVLVGGRHTAFESELATRQNFLAALESVVRGEPGILFFSGHACASGLGYDLESGIVLNDGVLTARELLDRGWLPEFGVPSRVVISACDSSGAQGSSAGQWLGLSAVLLSIGALQVVATAWNIPDTGETARFESELWQTLTVCPDVAEGLARLQREYLRAWRVAGSGFRRELLSPRMWAAFQCFGVLDGR